MKDLHIDVYPNENGELIVRQGEALPLKEPTYINFTGELPSVNNYLAKHGVDGDIKDPDNNVNHVKRETAIIYVNRQEKSITLVTDCRSPYSHSIAGKLELSEELKKFAINPSGTTQTREDLVKLLRFNKRFFSDKAKHAEILSAYQKFNVTTTGGLKVESDNRGNKDLGYNARVTTELPQSFFLEIPVFKGYPAAKFLVEICLDVSDASARFWLESPELEELIEVRAKELLDAEIKQFEKQYTVVYK